MSKKKVSYELNRKEYDKVKKMDHSQMQQWANNIYEKGQQSVPRQQSLPKDAKERLLSIKGIGETKANQIMEALVM